MRGRRIDDLVVSWIDRDLSVFAEIKVFPFRAVVAIEAVILLTYEDQVRVLFASAQPAVNLGDAKSWAKVGP